jgi:hypothetical protein
MRIGRVEQAWGAEALRPAVGWKVWRVEDGRLVSVLYGDSWPVDEPVRAVCRRHAHVSHEAPSPACECGIHAGRELGAWDHYLAVGAQARVFGRVLLWGSTVEGASGWRAALARPVEIFVPHAVERREEVAEALRAYGVPVHVLEPVEEAVPA